LKLWIKRIRSEDYLKEERRFECGSLQKEDYPSRKVNAIVKKGCFIVGGRKVHSKAKRGKGGGASRFPGGDGVSIR